MQKEKCKKGGSETGCTCRDSNPGNSLFSLEWEASVLTTILQVRSTFNDTERELWYMSVLQNLIEAGPPAPFIGPFQS